MEEQDQNGTKPSSSTESLSDRSSSPLCEPIRTVKEYDEKLSAARKENFNLKLRIYLWEERHYKDMSPEIIKQVEEDVIRQTEIEDLRDQIKSNQRLLCQAVAEMDRADAERASELAKKDSEITAMMQQLEAMTAKFNRQRERINRPSKPPTPPTPHVPEAPLAIESLQKRIAELQLQLEMKCNENANRKMQEQHDALLSNDSRMRSVMKKIAEKSAQIEQVQTDATSLQAQLDDKCGEELFYCNKLRDVEDEINAVEKRIREAQQKTTELNHKRAEECRVDLQNDEIIKEQDAKIAELERTVEERKKHVAELERALELCDQFTKQDEAGGECKPLPEGMSTSEVKESLAEARQRIRKMEADRRKASRIMDMILKSRKKYGEQLEKLQNSMQERDELIQDMHERFGEMQANRQKK